MGRRCIVCRSPANVLEALNAAILAGQSVYELANHCAFSRATLFRHKGECLHRSRKAIRQAILEKHKFAARVQLLETKVNVCWPGETADTNCTFLVRVEYEDMPHRNPAREASETAEDVPNAIAEAAERVDAKAEEPKPEPPPQIECTHDWRTVAANVDRCQACGAQKPVFVPRGSPRRIEQQRGPFRTFGRFA
jgi:hypothetical protein